MHLLVHVFFLTVDSEAVGLVALLHTHVAGKIVFRATVSKHMTLSLKPACLPASLPCLMCNIMVLSRWIIAFAEDVVERIISSEPTVDIPSIQWLYKCLGDDDLLSLVASASLSCGLSHGRVFGNVISLWSLNFCAPCKCCHVL